MKINEQCLLCLVNQAVKTANLINAYNREVFNRNIFFCYEQIDFSKINPEIVGENFCLIKQHIGCDDPYADTKRYYNQLFIGNIPIEAIRVHCECAFGVLKQDYGFRRFLTAGKANVRTELFFLCLAYDLEKLWN